MDGYTIEGDCLEVMPELIRHRVTVQSAVTDGPYGIGFLGKDWDSPDNIVFRPEVWRGCYQLLPPGGHLLAFSSTRTYHRIACAIEDAGFEIRDQIQWVHGQGFPKGLNVAKSIDRIGRGATAWGGGDPESPNYRLYEGMGGNGYRTAEGMFNTHANKAAAREFVRKNPPPACELPKAKNPNVRDPAKNAEHHKRWQQGFKGNADIVPVASPEASQWEGWQSNLKPAVEPIVLARKPVEGSIARNVLRYGTGALNIGACRIECYDKTPFPEGITSDRGFMWESLSEKPRPGDNHLDSRYPANFLHDGSEEVIELLGDKARFFYCPKVGPKDRNGSVHPTVKPVALMRYLVRLVTPPGGLVLDPFAGTGTTGEAAHLEGFDYLLIERDPESVRDIERRLQKYNRAA